LALTPKESPKGSPQETETARRKRRAEAELRAQHEPQTLIIGGKVARRGASIEPQRISRVDEKAISDGVRDSETERQNKTREDLAVRLTRIEDDIQKMLIFEPRDQHVVTRQSVRDITSAAKLIREVRKRLA